MRLSSNTETFHGRRSKRRVHSRSNSPCIRFPVLTASLLLACLLPLAQAAEVYKWIDEQGITHYSDAAPQAFAPMLVDLPATNSGDSSAGNAAEDYYSISNQWQRMHRERLERERLEIERERIRAARQTDPATTPVPESAVEVRYLPVYAPLLRRPRLHSRYPAHVRQDTNRHRPPAAAENLGTFPTL